MDTSSNFITNAAAVVACDDKFLFCILVTSWYSFCISWWTKFNYSLAQVKLTTTLWTLAHDDIKLSIVMPVFNERMLLCVELILRKLSISDSRIKPPDNIWAVVSSQLLFTNSINFVAIVWCVCATVMTFWTTFTPLDLQQNASNVVHASKFWSVS